MDKRTAWTEDYIYNLYSKVFFCSQEENLAKLEVRDITKYFKGIGSPSNNAITSSIHTSSQSSHSSDSIPASLSPSVSADVSTDGMVASG